MTKRDDEKVYRVYDSRNGMTTDIIKAISVTEAKTNWRKKMVGKNVELYEIAQQRFKQVQPMRPKGK